MIQIHEIINNGAITTLKGMLLRDKQAIYFLFNGNDHEFRIDAKMVVPEFGLFEINNFSVEEVDLSVEEVNEILRYLPRTKKEDKSNKANNRKVVGKIISPMGCTPLYEGQNPIEVVQEIVKDYLNVDENLIGEEDVESSLIENIVYDKRTEVLTICFRTNQSVYVYTDVPEEVVLELLSAESKGRYFNKNIKGNYDYKQVQ